MKARAPIMLVAALLLLPLHGCMTEEMQGEKPVHSVILYVSTTKGEYDPLDIQVEMDDDIVVRDEFYVGDGHDWTTYDLWLTEGVHQLRATSNKGKAFIDVVFTVKVELGLVLTHWDEGHFQLGIFDQPVYLE